MDTPGGSVAGAFDVRDVMQSFRGKKPTLAIARDTMASAGYLIGSTADKVYTTQTGAVGSIGVVAMHLDRSEKNAKEGIKPTFLYAGDYKVAGNPHEKLEGEALEYLQESINDSYEMFINAVAESRSIDAKKIRATQARVYRGEKAVKAGLSDGIRSFDQALQELANNNPRVYQSKSIKGIKMDKEQFEQLAGELETAKESMTNLATENEKLRGYLISEGYSISAEGVTKAPAPDMIEIEGELIDKAALPASVVKALEAKAASEFKAEATAAFPNMKADVAVALYGAVGKDETVMAQLTAFDKMLETKMTETGAAEPDADMTTSKDKFDKMVAEHKAANPGLTREQAFAAVYNTAEGKALFTQKD